MSTFEQLNINANALPSEFYLEGRETSSGINFRKNSNKLVRIDTQGCSFSRQEMFNFAMVLLKLSTEIEEYK